MEESIRQYPLFSVCGLNCGLCPRYHTNGKSKCPGCGGEAFYTKHPVCGIISCAVRHGGIEYCFLCEEYPCKRYENADASDSFITHANQLKDIEKVKSIGLDAYQAELNKKIDMLNELLENYDDGRRKNFYCIAINLLDIQDVTYVMEQLKTETKSNDLTTKEKSLIAVRLFQEMADKRGISLTLRKK